MISSFAKKGELRIFGGNEVDVLKGVGSQFGVEVKVWGKGKEEDNSRALVLESQFT